ECLAIQEAIKYWQFWLIGKKFIVYTDHKPLENLNLKARTDEELGAIAYYLSQYNFSIKYSPGKENGEADCLSRNPVLNPDDNTEEKLKIVNFINMKEIMEDQKTNEEIQEKREKLFEENGLYYKKTKNNKKILLTESFSINFIKDVHGKFCHMGVRHMQNKISKVYTAKNLTKNINEICKNCETCIKNKSRR
ncbi:Retrotransposable element Tf2 155 kDa protein type 1, partial [Camponotus floridanus]